MLRSLGALLLGAVGAPLVVLGLFGLYYGGVLLFVGMPVASGYFLARGVASGADRRVILSSFGAASVGAVAMLIHMMATDGFGRVLGTAYGALFGLALFLLAGIGSLAAPRDCSNQSSG